MKPIEPGAVCIIKSGCFGPDDMSETPFLGLSVTVLRLSNSQDSDTCTCTRWRISGAVPFERPSISECCLLRIDDPDAVTEPTEQEIEA